MNCKTGDLAIVVKSKAGNEGKIVTCLELIPAYVNVLDVNGVFITFNQPFWKVDQEMKMFNNHTGNITANSYYCTDSCLLPLKADLNDETLDTKELETA